MSQEDDKIDIRIIIGFCSVIVIAILVGLWYVVRMALLEYMPQEVWLSNLIAIPIIGILALIIVIVLAGIVGS